MPRCQNNRAGKFTTIGCNDSTHLIAIDNQTLHSGLEMYRTTRFDNTIPHALDYPRQLVGPDVRVSIRKN